MYKTASMHEASESVLRGRRDQTERQFKESYSHRVLCLHFIPDANEHVTPSQNSEVPLSATADDVFYAGISVS